MVAAVHGLVAVHGRIPAVMKEGPRLVRRAHAGDLGGGPVPWWAWVRGAQRACAWRRAVRSRRWRGWKDLPREGLARTPPPSRMSMRRSAAGMQDGGVTARL